MRLKGWKRHFLNFSLIMRHVIEFASKRDLTHFLMSNAAKAFNTAHEEAVKMLLPFAIKYFVNKDFPL